MVRLAHLPSLGQTEAFQSFLSRLAAVNGATSLADFRRHFALKSHKSFACEETVSEISRLTGISRSILDDHQLLNVSGHGELWHSKLQWSNLHTMSARYCPLCVQGDYVSGSDPRDARPWGRGGWYGLNNFVCIEHSVELFTSPIQYSSTSKWDFTRHLRENQRELDTATWNATRNIPQPYDLYFDGRLKGKEQEVPLLDKLPYHIAYRLCELAGNLKLTSPADASLADLHEARREGFNMLANPHELLQCLDPLHEHHLARAKMSILYRVYGPFQKYLTQLADMPGARPLIDLVREHAMNALPIGPNDDFIGGGGIRKWHTMSTAQREYGIDRRTIREMLAERGVTNAAPATGRNILIEATHVEEVVIDFMSRSHIQYVRKTFGVRESTARRLVSAGLVEPPNGRRPEINTKISRKTMHGTLRKVISGLPESDESDVVAEVEGRRSRRAGRRHKTE
ncbi:hypothetical protein HFO58_31910 [Rhizobium leguminosarum]|uniref:TniQ family protein n=1 Tax=Rhizobium leguminosarum TaxID=384 RepID=UPI001C9379E8|nr:TniQ family protein [Rhizobium leguminosarum]MBY5537699.1 hypothetical protein [Rhizobium leguminosarum]